MSSHTNFKQKRPQTIQTQNDEEVQQDQQQMLLQKTLLREQQQALKQEQKYIERQNSNLISDKKDLTDLQHQIERIKKIKKQYKQQKNQIQKLNKVVQQLKHQNKSLRLEKSQIAQQDKRNEAEEGNKNSHKIEQRRFSSGKRCSRNIISVNRNQDNKNLFNTQSTGANQSLRQRYLSPQIGKRVVKNHFRSPLHGLRHCQPYNISSHPIFNSTFSSHFPNEFLNKKHQQNKRTVISSFVQQLKHQLQINELNLQKQKQAHRQTKSILDQTLTNLQETKILLRQKINNETIGNSNTLTIEKENQRMRREIERQTEKRIRIEHILNEKETKMKYYQAGLTIYRQEFDRELDKMDQIYFEIQRVIRL